MVLTATDLVTAAAGKHMNSEILLQLLNLIGLGAVTALIWYVKQFLSSQVKGYAEEFGKIDARLEKVDELISVEKRLKEAAGEVELAIKRTLDAEMLVRSKDIDFRERQLAEFYWPLYVRLQMNNSIYQWFERISANSPEGDRQLAVKVEQMFTLPNHREALKIVESKIHLMDKDPELEHLLLLYIRHVALFEALRALGINDKDPIDFGEPWPRDLFSVLARETKKRQEEFDILIHRRAELLGF